MKKQYVKDIKGRFQLPGKVALTLEDLFGQKEQLLGKLKNYLLNSINNANNIVSNYYQFGTTLPYTLR